MSADPESREMPEPLKDQLNAQWQEFLTRIPDREAPAETDKSRILRVWQYSDFAMQTSLCHPGWLLENLDNRHFSQPHARERLARHVRDVLSQVQSEADLLRCLRQLRHQEMLRILWRDISGEAALEETLAATSDLADLLVDAALDWLYHDACKTAGVPRNSEGAPQRLVVFGMGKLGGRELNFSSDIDLIFAWPEPGQTDGDRPLDNAQFFTRLGQRLIRALDQATADGFVYRVDMRLRPFGDSGALVMHFDAMEQYYEVHGREWERYALVKARPVAGNTAAGELLLERLRGFVYRRYLDYGVIESLRQMQAMIARQAAARGKENDLKVGPGGIREIEFIAQMFQLIHGGRNRHLQCRSLLPALAVIRGQDWLTNDDIDALEAAYRFLRRAENHLQMQYDRQVHALPDNDVDRWRLMQSMGYTRWEDFFAALDGHRENVQRIFQDLFQASASGGEVQAESVTGEKIWRAAGQDDAIVRELLTAAGMDDPDMAQRALRDFINGRNVRMLSEQGRQRLDKLMPLVLAEIIRGEHAARTLTQLLGFFDSIARRTAYLAFLTERPQTLDLLIRLCEASDWITAYLTRHPMLLDELLDPQTLFSPPDRAGLARELDEALRQIDSDDQEAWLNQLRHFKQTQVLRVAAADIMDALPLMQVSDHLTWIAEVVLDKVREYAWRELVVKHGEPVGGEGQPAGFVIIGYGKLGGLEMGYGSDLDLVFLHDAKGEQSTNGERPIANARFFARLGQRIISILNTFTTAGKLYEVDMRLRPSGSAGLLVSNIEAFRQYQQEKAWLWEHQALVRARPVCGSESLSERFVAIRHEILCQPRNAAEVATEVRKMREKMWETHKAEGKFDLKKSPGGITDIEFMVQYLVLAHAHEKPALAEWTDNIRILESLAKNAVIAVETAERLADIYRCFRDEIHRLTLKGEPAAVAVDRFAEERAFVQQCWQQLIER